MGSATWEQLRCPLPSLSLTTAVGLFAVLAADAHGQRLLEVDGVELRGEAQLVQSGGGTCNVLESDTRYEEKRANHGAPLDIWRLDFTVRNGSGRWLDHLIARFQVESEWPDCTNWDVSDSARLAIQYASATIEWGDSIGHIQESGRNVVSPDQTLTDTKLFIVLRGDPEPRFSNWSMDFDFAVNPPPARTARAEPSASPAASQRPPPAATAEQETVFWQSIVDSENPVMFEAYLSQFPNGVFRALAEARLSELRSPAHNPSDAVGRGAAAGGSPTFGSRLAEVGDAPRRPGEVFRDCDVCPEMVALPGGRLAMGRYEVTVDEYRAFASATGLGAGDCFGDSWRAPGFAQTDRHPVTCVGWEDAQAYVSWLSRTTGATYRLPTETEWARAAAGSQRGCDEEQTGNAGTCPVGSYGSNTAGLSDMVGNVWEWTEDCWEGDCGRRVVRGGAWGHSAENLRPGAREWLPTGFRGDFNGFRVARTLD